MFGKKEDKIGELRQIVSEFKQVMGNQSQTVDYSNMPDMFGEDLMSGEPLDIEATATEIEEPKPQSAKRGRKPKASEDKPDNVRSLAVQQRKKLFASVKQQIGEYFIFAICSAVVLFLFKNQLVLTSLGIFVAFAVAHLVCIHKYPKWLPVLTQVVISFGIVLCLFLLGLRLP